jgi:hypothetical protein
MRLVLAHRTGRSATTLAQLCADLGPALVDVAAAPRGVDVEISDVAFHDALDGTDLRGVDRHVVLAVGVPADTGALHRLVHAAGAAGAAAVAARASEVWPAELLAAAEQAGVALLAVPAEATWGDLYELIRTAVAADRGGDPAGIGRPALGDLFALADATAALANGPVTIEDLQSRVLAFSGGQTIDQGRMATILERRVPERWIRELRQLGVLDRLLTSEDVVRIELEDSEPRRAIAIRAGGTMVGSIWLAGCDTQLSPDADVALIRAAKVAAVHLMRERTTDDLERRLRGRALAALLDGQGDPAAALRQVGLPAGGLVVLAIELDPAAESPAPGTGERLVDLVTMHLHAYRRRAVATLFDGRVYVLAASAGAEDREALRELAADALERARVAIGVELRAGLGEHVDGPERLSASRRSADRSVALGSGRVTAAEEVHGPALLADVEAFVAGWSATVSPQLRALADHDRDHGTEYVLTLRAVLDALGNAAQAARALHVHVNTVRYRMRRVSELTGIDLGDGDARLALELELRARGS